MSISRRELLKNGALLSAAALTTVVPGRSPAIGPRVPPMLNPDALVPFVDPLWIPDMARPYGLSPDHAHPGRKTAVYRMTLGEFHRRIHRDLKPTRMWGINGQSPGPTLMTRRGEPVEVKWVNALPRKHFLPIDHTLHGAEPGLPEVRAVIHVHGARTASDSDGYPENWTVPGQTSRFYYPNDQEAATLWYHDHAMGINRLNIYAGLTGLFVVGDETEDALELPSGQYSIPMVICDRMLTRDAQLYYPVSGKPGAPWVPEVFGDAILINGGLFPYLAVEPRRYRLRILNGANGRFFRLSMPGGPPIYQIASDQGLLAAPLEVKTLILAPAERADLVIDFAAFRGREVLLSNDLRPIMQFRVGGNPVHDTSRLPAALRPIPRMSPQQAVKTRMLSLAEYDDPRGNSMIMYLGGARWSMPVTERPVIDTTEIWNLINLTDDSHPIHLHLVRFQILDRRSFDDFEYANRGVLKYTGPAMPPDANEMGWKDTVRAEPKMVTRIIVRFEGFTGRYVWHCHILEHEDNEMMRPFEVITAQQAAQSPANPATADGPRFAWCQGDGIVPGR